MKYNVFTQIIDRKPDRPICRSQKRLFHHFGIRNPFRHNGSFRPNPRNNACRDAVPNNPIPYRYNTDCVYLHLANNRHFGNLWQKKRAVQPQTQSELFLSEYLIHNSLKYNILFPIIIQRNQRIILLCFPTDRPRPRPFTEFTLGNGMITVLIVIDLSSPHQIIEIMPFTH